MGFRLQQREDYTMPRTSRPTAAQLAAAHEQLSLLDGAVFMDDRASGSGGLGGLLHGRGGNEERIGFTISVDLALAQHGAPGSSGLWGPTSNQIMSFFSATEPQGHFGSRNPTASGRGTAD